MNVAAILFSVAILFHIILIDNNLCFCQSLKPVASGSKISFTIKNLGINTTGYFKQIGGVVDFFPDNLTASKFDVSIPTKSLETDNNLRDKHLKKEEYLDIEKYPSMHFTSTRISLSSPGNYKVSGNLTIKETTKSIQFEFKATRQGNGYLFTASFPLNRRDFNVGSKSLTMSEDLNVRLSIVATK